MQSAPRNVEVEDESSVQPEEGLRLDEARSVGRSLHSQSSEGQPAMDPANQSLEEIEELMRQHQRQLRDREEAHRLRDWIDDDAESLASSRSREISDLRQGQRALVERMLSQGRDPEPLSRGGRREEILIEDDSSEHRQGIDHQRLSSQSSRVSREEEEEDNSYPLYRDPYGFDDHMVSPHDEHPRESHQAEAPRYQQSESERSFEEPLRPLHDPEPDADDYTYNRGPSSQSTDIREVQRCWSLLITSRRACEPP